MAIKHDEDTSFVGRAEDYRLCEVCGRNYPIKEIAGKCQFPQCGIWACTSCALKCDECHKIFCPKHARILEEKYLKDGDKKGKVGCHNCVPFKRCFIATACYGINSDEVKIFRDWRDNTLLKRSYGKKFINFYYKISPSIADFIFDRPLLKKIIRISLFPLKEIIK